MVLYRLPTINQLLEENPDMDLCDLIEEYIVPAEEDATIMPTIYFSDNPNSKEVEDEIDRCIKAHQSCMMKLRLLKEHIKTPRTPIPTKKSAPTPEPMPIEILTIPKGLQDLLNNTSSRT